MLRFTRHYVSNTIKAATCIPPPSLGSTHTRTISRSAHSVRDLSTIDCKQSHAKDYGEMTIPPPVSNSDISARILVVVLFLAAGCSHFVMQGSGEMQERRRSWQHGFVTGLYAQVQERVTAGNISECHGMAEILDGIADVAGSPSQFSKLLGTFIAPSAAQRANPALLSAFSRDWNPARQGPLNRFQRATGFAAEFIDSRDPSNDPASRFACVFQLSFSTGGLPPSAFRLRSLDDPDMPNMKLAIAASVLAAAVRNGELSMHDVGRHVRKNLCAQAPAFDRSTVRSFQQTQPPVLEYSSAGPVGAK